MSEPSQAQWSTRDVARLLSLVESERRYFQEIVTSLPVATAVVSSSLSFCSANSAFRTLFGLPLHGELTGLLDLALPIAALRANALEVFRTGQPFSSIYPRVATAAGICPIRLTLTRLRGLEDGSTELLVQVENLSNYFTDLTVSAPRIQFIPIVFWTVSLPAFQFESVTGPGLASLPLPRDQWTEQAGFWSSRIIADDLAEVKAFYQLLLSGSPVRSCEYRATSTGSEPLWLRDLVALERLPGGTPVRLHGATIDVTHTRRREDAAAQASRVAALTRMASLIAHECNNLLMILSGYGEELNDKLDPSNPLRAHVQEILYAGGRLSSLTRQLTEFVRHAPVHPQKLPLDAWLADIHWQLRQEVPRAIELVMSLKSAGASVWADPAILRGVVQELIQRAVDAMPNGGTLTIETSPYELSDAITAHRATLRPGAYVQLTIRDSGTPIPPGAFQRLFEPQINGDSARHHFAGLYATIREMEGDFSVQSEPDRGTACTILLAQTSAAAVASQPPTGAEPLIAAPPSKPPTVLVVEDERRIRTLICKILSRYGYQTVEAADGREALELARAHSTPFDLLLTDVVMPGFSGVELADALRAIQPELPVLFISGYPGVPGLATSQLPPGSTFLQKPFTLQSLVARVRETIGTGRAGAAAAS
jgi:signal transduction histidine kinase/CheY-like chemotaxis protein